MYRTLSLATFGLLPVLLLFAGFLAPARALETSAPIAFLFIYDPGLAESSAAISPGDGASSDFLSAGTVLYSKAADQPFSPGSIAKVMTAATVFDAINRGDLRESQTCQVSVHAWRTGGAPSGRTTMFAEVKSFISIADLLKGLIIQNANDAAIALAECIDGSEEAFARRMTTFAHQIGMQNSTFVNPTGYDPKKPEEAAPETKPQVWGQSTARDLVRLAIYLYERQPQTFKLFSASDFVWNGIFQRNKNPLIGDVRGLDGLAAGQSDRDGYSGLAAIERQGRRYFAVVAGEQSAKQRGLALEDLMDGALKEFSNRRLFEAGEQVAQARVFGGVEGNVPLAPTSPVDVLLPRIDTLDYRIRVVYSGPLKAPVEKGQTVGELRVVGSKGVVHRQPLITTAAVARGDMPTRALSTLREVLFGWY